METYSSEWKSYVKPKIVPETSSLDCNWALQALTFPHILYKQISQKKCALFTMTSDKTKGSPDTLTLIMFLNSASLPTS